MQALGYTHTVATGHTDLQPGMSQEQCVDRTGSFLGQQLLLPVNKLQACREGAAFLPSFLLTAKWRALHQLSETQQVGVKLSEMSR